MMNSNFYQKNRSMMPQQNSSAINIETNDNQNIVFVPQKSTQYVYMMGSQPGNLLGSTLIPVFASGEGKYLTATEKNLQIIDEVKKTLEKNQNLSSNILNVNESYMKDKAITRCDLHPKQLSDKCRKCKEIRNTILKQHEEKQKPLLDTESNDNNKNISIENKEKQQNIDNEQTSGDMDPIFKVHGDLLTGNLNQLIFNNILSCQYFKEDVAFKGFNDIVLEIVQNVTYAEPWAVGRSGVPSTLFCCLYKLMLIKLTESQISYMLNNREYPYLRCTGFLYLRYLSDPKELWKRLSKYIFDEEVFSPTANTKYKLTIGEYVENLLKDYDYYGTRLHKIPTQFEREIKAKLISVEEKRERKRKNEGKLNLFLPGAPCSAVSLQDNKWHEAIIISLINNNKQAYVKFINGSDELISICEGYKTENKRQNFEVFKAYFSKFSENHTINKTIPPFYISEEIVDLGDIDLISRASLVEEKHTYIEMVNEIKANKREKEEKHSRSRSKSRTRRHKKDKKKRRHDSSRSLSSSPTGRKDSRHQRHHKDREYEHSHRERNRKSRSRSTEYDNKYKSREIEREGDKSKEAEKKIFEKILENEREAVVAKGKDYSFRPTGYKSALYAKLPGKSRKRSKSPSPLKQNIQTIEKKIEKKDEESRHRKEYSKDFLNRQQNLQKQYGQSSNSGYAQKAKTSKDDLGPEIMKLG